MSSRAVSTGSKASRHRPYRTEAPATPEGSSDRRETARRGCVATPRRAPRAPSAGPGRAPGRGRRFPCHNPPRTPTWSGRRRLEDVGARGSSPSAARAPALRRAAPARRRARRRRARRRRPGGTWAIAPVNAGRAAAIAARRRTGVRPRHDLAVRVQRVGLLAPGDFDAIALVRVHQEWRRSWSPRRARSAERRWRGGQACRRGRPSGRRRAVALARPPGSSPGRPACLGRPSPRPARPRRRQAIPRPRRDRSRLDVAPHAGIGEKAVHARRRLRSCRRGRTSGRG